MRGALKFLQYNNGVPIALFLILGGSGIAFAATPQLQQGVYSAQQQVRSVDNTYVISADLSKFDFALKITNVVEDADNYYVTYTYNTIGIDKDVWKQLSEQKTMTVGKKEIVGKDLGLFVADQLSQVIEHQMSLLTQVQAQEKQKGETTKVVTTTYSGLIGKMFSPTDETFPGYAPVVAEAPIEGNQVAAAVESGESHDAFPHVQSPEEIKAMIDSAIANALTAGQPAATTTVADETTATTTDDTGVQTPPADTPPVDTPPATTTPPVDTPPATTTPPVDTPPATTSPEDTTPPVVEAPPPTEDTSSSTTSQ